MSKQDKKKEIEFHFSKEQVTIKASSLEEAIKKLKKKK